MSRGSSWHIRVGTTGESLFTQYTVKSTEASLILGTGPNSVYQAKGQVAEARAPAHTQRRVMSLFIIPIQLTTLEIVIVQARL